MQSCADDGQEGIRLPRFDPFSNQHVEPVGVKSVLLKVLLLEQGDEVLDSRPKVAADGEFFEGDDEVLPGVVASLAPREAVAKLGVGELVEASGRGHAEVAPHVLV